MHAAIEITQSAICTVDAEILFWSGGAVTLFGYTPDEAVGTICHNLLKSELPAPHTEILREVLRIGRWQGKYWVQRKDGQRIFVGVHWAIFGDSPGQPVQVMLTFVEFPSLTSRNAPNDIGDALMIMDEQFRITYLDFEAERILGTKRDTLIGRSLWEVYPEAIGTRIHYESLRTVRDRMKSSFENYFEPWDRWFQSTVFPERDGGLSIIFRDITERVKAEETRRASENALRALTAGLFSIHDQERRGISNELHDTLNQEIVALQLDLSRLTKMPGLGAHIQDQIERVSGRIAELSDGLTRIACQLHPSILDHLGLEVAIRAYTTEFALRENIKCRFLTRNPPDSLSPEMGICLYRVLQHALENVACHAQAERVIVHLSSEGNEVVLSVRDYGKGFDVEADTGRGGLGLIHMRERVRHLQGRLIVQSRAGCGATIVARVPLTGQTQLDLAASAR